MKKIDLHIHTTASDGTFAPKELVDYAIKKGLSAISITDHDTMRGIEEANDYISSNNLSLELIPGMEVSSYSSEHYGLHILAYFIDKNDMERENIVMNFEKELNNSNKTPENVLSLISKYGGLSSLGHPQEYGLSINKLDTLLGKLVGLGLNGVEGIYTTHSDQYISDITRIANKHKLIITGGSDFHGARKPGVDLGCGFGDMIIPYEIIDSLKSCAIRQNSQIK